MSVRERERESEMVWIVHVWARFDNVTFTDETTIFSNILGNTVCVRQTAIYLSTSMQSELGPIQSAIKC